MKCTHGGALQVARKCQVNWLVQTHPWPGRQPAFGRASWRPTYALKIRSLTERQMLNGWTYITETKRVSRTFRFHVSNVSVSLSQDFWGIRDMPFCSLFVAQRCWSPLLGSSSEQIFLCKPGQNVILLMIHESRVQFDDWSIHTVYIWYRYQYYIVLRHAYVMYTHLSKIMTCCFLSTGRLAPCLFQSSTSSTKWYRRVPTWGPGGKLIHRNSCGLTVCGICDHSQEGSTSIYSIKNWLLNDGIRFYCDFFHTPHTTG